MGQGGAARQVITKTKRLARQEVSWGRLWRREVLPEALHESLAGRAPGSGSASAHLKEALPPDPAQQTLTSGPAQASGAQRDPASQAMPHLWSPLAQQACPARRCSYIMDRHRSALSAESIRPSKYFVLYYQHRIRLAHDKCNQCNHI